MTVRRQRSEKRTTYTSHTKHMRADAHSKTYKRTQQCVHTWYVINSYCDERALQYELLLYHNNLCVYLNVFVVSYTCGVVRCLNFKGFPLFAL